MTVVPPLSIGPPLAVSPTKPDAPDTSSSDRLLRFACASVPRNVTWKPLSLSAPVPPQAATVAIPPAGQPGIDSSAALIPAVV